MPNMFTNSSMCLSEMGLVASVVLADNYLFFFCMTRSVQSGSKPFLLTLRQMERRDKASRLEFSAQLILDTDGIAF